MARLTATEVLAKVRTHPLALGAEVGLVPRPQGQPVVMVARSVPRATIRAWTQAIRKGRRAQDPDLAAIVLSGRNRYRLERVNSSLVLKRGA